MRWLWLLVLLGCGKKSLGEECSYSSDCDTKHCALGRCTNGQPGELCDKDYHCDDKCWRGLCRKPVDGVECTSASDCGFSLQCIADKCVSKEHVAAANAAKEAKMLAQSGVDEKPALEKQVSPAAAGPRVRVATATAKEAVFAACRSDERLVGGGCRETGNNRAFAITGSYPTNHSETDTTSGRWTCEVYGNAEVTAYALCAKVP